MPEFKTVYDDCKRRGVDFEHPLGKISVIGSLVEEFPPGSYAYLSTHCPTINSGPSYQSSLGWFVMDGHPPKAGNVVPWLCDCFRAERLFANVISTIIIREDAPAILDGNRSPLWPVTFETIDLGGPLPAT